MTSPTFLFAIVGTLALLGLVAREPARRPDPGAWYRAIVAGAGRG